MRGENVGGSEYGLPNGGTSPRARGKLIEQFGVSSIHRNIPACAGKTSVQTEALFAEQEHPRVRGENV